MTDPLSTQPHASRRDDLAYVGPMFAFLAFIQISSWWPSTYALMYAFKTFVVGRTNADLFPAALHQGSVDASLAWVPRRRRGDFSVGHHAEVSRGRRREGPGDRLSDIISVFSSRRGMCLIRMKWSFRRRGGAVVVYRGTDHRRGDRGAVYGGVFLAGLSMADSFGAE